MAGDIVQFEMKGLKEIQEALEERLPKEARLAMRIALSAGGGTIKTAMQDGAPVEVDGQYSGFLRDNIKVKTVIRNGGLAGTAIVGATTAAYPGREGSKGRVTLKTATGKVVSFISNKAGQVTAAMVARWLELGTSKMSAHPFLTRAWESSKQAALERMIAKLKETLHL
jgi:HK97 gp10 family phage protein